MNKRIEELAEQADLLGDFTPTKIAGRYAGTINIADIEKFAELIVRECAIMARGYEVALNRGKELSSTMLEHFEIENERTN